MPTRSFDHASGLIESWGYERRITSNASVEGQLNKTVEKANKGIDASNALARIPLEDLTSGEHESGLEALADELDDALRNVGVTWIMACRAALRDPADMLYLAYDEIKDRTGHLGADGIFYRDADRRVRI